MASGGVTVPSVFGKTTSFTVSGLHTLQYSERFGDALSAALRLGTLSYNNLSNPGAIIPGYTENLGQPASIFEQEVSSGGHFVLPDTVPGNIYTLVSASGPTTIDGSGLGDNVLVEGAAPDTTYFDDGGNNLVTFVNGDNSYVGDETSSDGSDTIVAGSGHDTITTGAGHAVVYAGSGHGEITLYDTVAAGATNDPKSNSSTDYNQFLYSDEGPNVIHADGTADVVVATAPSQQIFDGATGQTDLIVIVPPSADGSSPPGAAIPTDNDVVSAGAAHVSVYDATNGNTIMGGTGSLTAVFAGDVDATVRAGSGSNTLWGSDGTAVSYISGSSSQGVFVAGAGAETVDASGALGQLVMVLGEGQEALTAGAHTYFNANYAAPSEDAGTVTINDFGSSDVFNFVGYTADQYNAALATGTVTATGYSITLSDDTKVTFVGLSSLTGHTMRT